MFKNAVYTMSTQRPFLEIFQDVISNGTDIWFDSQMRTLGNVQRFTEHVVAWYYVWLAKC